MLHSGGGDDVWVSLELLGRAFQLHTTAFHGRKHHFFVGLKLFCRKKQRSCLLMLFSTHTK